MAYTVENACVGCPQGCIHCGRDQDRLVVTCDICGENIEFSDFSDIRKLDDNEVCDECFGVFEDALATLEQSMDTLDAFGKLILGAEEWQRRKKQIDEALEELYAEV